MATPTNKEMKWFKKLQKVLNECPSDRIEFYAGGGSYVSAWTGDDYDIHLFDFNFPGSVHSTDD